MPLPESVEQASGPSGPRRTLPHVEAAFAANVERVRHLNMGDKRDLNRLLRDHRTPPELVMLQIGLPVSQVCFFQLAGAAS